MSWRKAWARTWDDVRYCSDACRRRKLTPDDQRLEAAIRDLLAQRPHGASICPSEAARRVSPDSWRDLMEPARRAARRLTAQGEVVITQGGAVVDPSTAKGPIRVRWAQA
jgi:sarcosine oxidase gamma subunit